MRFKYSLLSTFLFLTLVCASSISFANGCDDLIINVHNNTAHSVYLNYHTVSATPRIYEGVVIAAGETVPLEKIINVGSAGHTTTTLELTSIKTAKQQDYVYATNHLNIFKYYSSFGSQAGVIEKNSNETFTDYKFQIDYSHEQQGVCSNDVNQAKPGEVTVEISSPVKQKDEYQHHITVW